MQDMFLLWHDDDETGSVVHSSEHGICAFLTEQMIDEYLKKNKYGCVRTSKSFDFDHLRTSIENGMLACYKSSDVLSVWDLLDDAANSGEFKMVNGQHIESIYSHLARESIEASLSKRTIMVCQIFNDSDVQVLGRFLLSSIVSFSCVIDVYSI